ncbi:hypothetical protein ACF0H5_023623 [Mactra antiquata]
MGTCGGKQDVISQSSIVTIETASEDVRKMNSGRKTSDKIVLPNSKMIESASQKRKSETYQDQLGGDTIHRNSLTEEQLAHDEQLNDRIEEINNEQEDNKNELNGRAEVCEHSTQNEMEFEPFNAFAHEAGEFDAGYQRIINKDTMGDSDGEWLEVINEVDEFELGNSDGISLVESEIIENCANIMKNGNKASSDKSSVGSASTIKERKKSGGKEKLKRSDSTGSGKSIKTDKKKTDKDKVNKLNKTNQDKLWTSRSQNKSNWKEEKIYTTKGKDGVLFKIKIMKRSPDEKKLINDETKNTVKKGKETDKKKSESTVKEQGSFHEA